LITENVLQSIRFLKIDRLLNDPFSVIYKLASSESECDKIVFPQ